MLCRTADDLYWTARHVERAENTARLLDVTQRIAMLPERLDRGKAQSAPWRRALDALGAVPEVEAAYGSITPEHATDYLLLSRNNPSSIYNCFHTARENARAQRGTITAEMYEDLNSSWLEFRGLDADSIRQEGSNAIIERIKSRSASFRGVTIGTLGRGEGYHFLRLGTFVERAEWAIRLLDVVASDDELPETGEARDATQYFQWSALLQSLSAFETYRRLYRDSVNPRSIAALMLLETDNPRALQTCEDTLHNVLRTLAGGESLEVVRQAGALAARSRYALIDEIIQGGLEAWLQDTMDRLVRLGAEIHRQFMTAVDVPSAPMVQMQTQQ